MNAFIIVSTEQSLLSFVTPSNSRFNSAFAYRDNIKMISKKYEIDRSPQSNFIGSPSLFVKIPGM